MSEEIIRYESVGELSDRKIVDREYVVTDERGKIGHVNTRIITYKEPESEDDVRIVNIDVFHRRGEGHGRRLLELVLRELACQTTQRIIRITAVPEAKSWWRHMEFKDTPELGPNEMEYENPLGCVPALKCKFRGI